jgi:hypothetical protein
LVAFGGLLLVGAGAQAHHAVAGVYDLNKEIVLEGQLTKLNFVNPHASIHLAVPNADGSATEWILTIHQARRQLEDHGPSGEKREPGGIHPSSRARRPRVQSRHRIKRQATLAGWGK